MTTIPFTCSPKDENWELPYRGTVGMYCLIFGESAMFIIFIVAYLYYMGRSLSGPTPAQVLEPPIFISICLFSSSLTVHWSAEALRNRNQMKFLGWLAGTILLGVIFLLGTGKEWYGLIVNKNFNIATNMFGTTFYSLVGLHAFHVTVGLLMLGIALVLGIFGKVTKEHFHHYHTLTLYWHFVDAVWVAVFIVVYFVSR